MLYAAVLVIVVAIGLLTIQLSRQSGTPARSLGATALRAGACIGLIRLGLFWGGLALYTGHADWRQVAGYALLTLNAVVELAVAASLSHGRADSSLVVTGLIVITSLVLGVAWGLVRFRRRTE